MHMNLGGKGGEFVVVLEGRKFVVDLEERIL